MADSIKTNVNDQDDGEFELESPTFDGLDGVDAELPGEDTWEGLFAADQPTDSSADDEFIIPDSAGFDSAFPAKEYISTLARPYVPRFTEVTENRNYFADQSIVREAERAAEQSRNRSASRADGTAAGGKTGAVASGKGGIVVERVDPAEMPDNTPSGRIDPIAEIESAVPEAVVVNINGGGNTKKSTINVFKFPEARDGEDAPAVDDEELERREISDLTGHQWDAEEGEGETEAEAEEISAEPAVESEPVQAPTEDNEESVYEQEIPADYNYMPLGYEANESARAASDNSEYTSPAKHETFKDRFLDSLMSIRIRLIVAVLLGLATAVFELFPSQIIAYFGLGLAPNAAAFIDCALIVALLLISLPEIARGITSLVGGTLASEITALLAQLFMLAYTVYIAFAMPQDHVLVGTVCAVITVNQIVSTLYSECAAFDAFKLVSMRGVKQIIDIRKTRELETHNHALDGVVDESRSRCVRGFSTAFVSGFVANSKRTCENTKNNLIIASITFGVALVLGAVLYFLSGALSAFTAFVIVIALATPAPSVLSHKLPFYYAEREAKAEGSAVIGEGAMYTYSAADVMIFEDTEVFGPDDVTLKSASDRRSTYHESMRKISSLLNAVGGPLSVVFESALGKHYAPATNVKVMDGGISGTVDGKRIIAGTWEFMNDMGVALPAKTALRIGSTRIIYAAEDGEFFGTFTVHYSFSEEFALMLSAMKERGIVPLVYTRDFNLDNEFMKGLTSGSDIIRVMKRYDTLKESTPLPRVKSPMVVTADKTAMLDAVIRAKRYTQLQSWICGMEISASASGAALAVAITLCGMTNALPMILIGAWQIGWGVVLGIISKKNFTTRKKDNEDA